MATPGYGGLYLTCKNVALVCFSYCPASGGLCPEFVTASRANKGSDLLEKILAVSFPIEDSSPSQQFRFAGRSGAYEYTIYNYLSGQFRVVSHLWTG